MKISIKYLFLIFALLTIVSCNKGTKIMFEGIDIGLICDTTLFRGIKPNIYYRDLCTVVGEPNEYIDMKSVDEEDHNPIYYFKEAKVMCYWSGSKRDKLGTIVYTPYLNTHLRVDNFIKCPLYEYNIDSGTESISVYKKDTLYFIIHLDKLEIKDISYMLLKK